MWSLVSGEGFGSRVLAPVASSSRLAGPLVPAALGGSSIPWGGSEETWAHRPSWEVKLMQLILLKDEFTFYHRRGATEHWDLASSSRQTKANTVQTGTATSAPCRPLPPAAFLPAPWHPPATAVRFQSPP